MVVVICAGCLQAAKEARYDKEGVMKFFRMVSMVFDIFFFLKIKIMGFHLNFPVTLFS